MYVSPEIRCQFRGRNLVNVHCSNFCFKLEDMSIITAVTYIIMHSCAHYNSITVFYLKKTFISKQGISARSFYGKRKESTGMRVIEEIPASSSDSESSSDEDQEVIFSQHEIEALNQGSSDEEDESSDEEGEEMDHSTESKRAKGFR